MKLIVEIETRDDKKQTHICNDFVGFGDQFITLYKEGMRREHIRTETVKSIKTFLKK